MENKSKNKIEIKIVVLNFIISVYTIINFFSIFFCSTMVENEAKPYQIRQFLVIIEKNNLEALFFHALTRKVGGTCASMTPPIEMLLYLKVQIESAN